MGKGSARRKEDWKRIQYNWDLIDWGNPGNKKCFNCGGTIPQSSLQRFPHLFEVYDDGNVSHKECNFN